MIDLALQAATQAALLTRLAALGLLNATTDPLGNPVYLRAPGFDFCWWAGSGKLMTAAAVVDPAKSPMDPGYIVTPATFLAGFVMLARLGDAADAISSPADGEQWSRSRVAQFIKNNGTLGSIGGISCYTLSGVRMVRAADLFAWLQINNLPGHEWAGGNAL